jgi:hypothetical protein
MKNNSNLDNENIVVIHQPDFLPYLGFYQKLIKSDEYIILDHVQFIKRGWHNRDLIKTSNGKQWLTVPVITKGKLKQSLNDTQIDNSQDWRRRHINAMQRNYAKAPFFKDFFDEIKEIYDEKHDLLIELNIDFIKYFLAKFNIKIQMDLSSKMDPQGTKNELLVDLSKKRGATFYLTGTGSNDYLDENLFKKNGIRVVRCKFEPKAYPQLFGDFIPNLSALDFLFNCGTNLGGYLD